MKKAAAEVALDASADAKKTERMIRNRFLAKRSREIAKSHVQLLEKTVAILSKQVHILATRLAFVSVAGKTQAPTYPSRQHFGGVDKGMSDESEAMLEFLWGRMEDSVDRQSHTVDIPETPGCGGSGSDDVDLAEMMFLRNFLIGNAARAPNAENVIER